MTKKLEKMTALEQIQAIMSAASHVMILDENFKEVERFDGFPDKASAMIFSDALNLPKGYTTVIGSQVL
jgi:hypothetical protein